MPASSLSLRRLKLLLQDGQLHHLGVQILGVAGVLLLSSVLLLGLNVSGLEKSFAWVQETDAELIQIADVEKALSGLELTVRGHALTGDPTFLRYYAYERRSLAAAVGALSQSLANDPDIMKSRFTALRGLIDKRVGQLAVLVTLGPDRAGEVASAIRDPKYRDTMRAARALIAQLRASELDELADREEAASRQAGRSYAMAAGIVVAAFAFGAVGLALMRFGRGRT